MTLSTKAKTRKAIRYDRNRWGKEYPTDNGYDQRQRWLRYYRRWMTEYVIIYRNERPGP